MLRLVVADLLFSFGSQFLGYALGDHSRPAINPLEEMVYPAKQKKTGWHTLSATDVWQHLLCCRQQTSGK